jgi:hypothetical protein
MNTDKTALLFGPYRPPPLQVGERHWCLLRRAEVVVYDWSLAPTPWPLCYHAETRARGKGLLIEDELARAIRHESATAVAHWWGISRATLRNWRAAFGVGRMDTEGSRRLIHGNALDALNARHKHRWPEVRLWTGAELGLLEKLPDAEVSRITGRTPQAVAVMRRERRRRPHRADCFDQT